VGYIFVAESLGTSSTPLIQAPQKLLNLVKKHKIRAIMQSKVVQGHQFWYQSKAHISLPISD